MARRAADDDSPLLFTVARGLGHSGVKVLEERYGHLLIDRRRLPFVEYRFEEDHE